MPEHRGGAFHATAAEVNNARATLQAARPVAANRGGLHQVERSPPQSGSLIRSPPIELRGAYFAIGDRATRLQPVPLDPEPDDSPRTASRNAGILISAVVHFCFVIGLALILGPVHRGPDEPLRLDAAVTASDAIPEVLELDASIDAELTAVQLAPAAVLQQDIAQGTLSSLTGVVDGRGRGQRGTFFGTVAYGNQFVYVLDVSGSMNQMRDRKYKLTRFEYAAEELLRSVGELAEDQYFYVVLFSDDARPMFDEQSVLPHSIPATKENKERLRKWLATVRPGSGTDPRAALRTALRMQPSAVFLLSDGEFNGQKRRNNASILRGNPSVEEVIDEHNRMRTPINTISYEEPQTRARMEALATQTGGEHRYVPPLKIAGSK